MQLTSLLYLLAATEAVQAVSFTEIKRNLVDIFSTRQSNSCPAVWTDIYKELSASFTTFGQCNDDARAAIRLAFHDCFGGSKCDGSLILANECARKENHGLENICAKIGSYAKEKNVGVADLIQFAGVCPLGPNMPVYVGRKDSSVPTPEGLLPTPFDSADKLIDMFAARGFSPVELVALIGAHSTSKQFSVEPAKAGAPQDSTPGIWDVLYYGQTIAGTAPVIFQSDKNLAKSPKTAKTFSNFAVNQRGWDAAFVPAMTKMSLLGIPGGAASLKDCSKLIKRSTVARDVKASELNARAI